MSQIFHDEKLDSKFSNLDIYKYLHVFTFFSLISKN